MEIITGVERRRHWRIEDKLRIVAETEQPGMSVAAVARRHEISRGLLYRWRRQCRESEWVERAQPKFVPLRIVDGTPSAAPLAPAASGSPDHRIAKWTGMMEIELGDGRRVRVDRDVDGAALRRVIDALGPR